MWSDKIDNFLTGKMSASEAAEFQSEVAGNPELQSELASQQDLIDALKQQRKDQLKAKLAAIPVSAGLTALQKSGIIGASLLALLGTGFAIMSNNGQVESTKLQSEVNTISPVKSTTETSAENTIELAENTPHLVEDETVVDVMTSHKSEVIVDRNESVNPRLLDQVNAVDLPDGEDEINITEGGTATDFNSTSTGQATILRPERINQSRKALEYKYDGENLTLSGNYASVEGEKPTVYELENKEIYLKFNGGYYSLTSTKGKFELLNRHKVVNPVIIEALEKTAIKTK